MNEIKPSDPVSLFRALSEEARLRLLGMLSAGEFSVQELTEALKMPQSTISRHLGRLREAGLVETRRDGTLIFYSKGSGVTAEVWEFIEPRLSNLPAHAEDRKAAQRLLDRRRQASQAYFDRMARRYSEVTEPGGSWEALAGALAMGYDGKDVADAGAGEGELTLRLAASARMVYAIDHSREMVKLLREKTRRLKNVVVSEGDLEDLPLDDASCDVVFLSQVLHHCAQPKKALKEAHRILRRNGRLIVIDLDEHQHEWTRKQLGDQWLGFDPEEVRAWTQDAGFAALQVHDEPTAHEALDAFVLTGIKADARVT